MQISSRLLFSVLGLYGFPAHSAEIGTGCVDGVDCTPPMGWRSWNTFGGDVSQQLMMNVMDAMVDTSRNGVSFAYLGYSDVGLDDNYQSCGEGVNGTFHEWSDASNAYVNMIREDTFPDMKSMTDYAHQLGLTAGFYENNCICAESGNYENDNDSMFHYQGDVADMVTYGYDSVKLDGCGPFLNLTLYQELLNNTGKYYLIENCHWGNTIPTLDWCPWSYFRTSGDISNNWASMFANLQTTIPYQDMDTPLSRPGCWAYPDMLEVGNLASYQENRAHFGAWCITSSPLILGHNVTNQTENDEIWDIVSNEEAIAVNQAWNGHPGYLVSSYNPSSDDTVYTWAQSCDDVDVDVQAFTIDMDSQFVYRTSDGLTIDYSLKDEMVLTEKGSSNNQGFIYQDGQLIVNCDNCCNSLEALCCLDVYDFNGPEVQIYPCNGGTNQLFFLNISTSRLQDANNHCINGLLNQNPNDDNLIQIWVKPLLDHQVAVFIISSVTSSSNDGDIVVIHFDEIGYSSTTNVTIRDVWAKDNIEGFYQSSFTTPPLASHDSFFYVFTPVD